VVTAALHVVCRALQCCVCENADILSDVCLLSLPLSCKTIVAFATAKAPLAFIVFTTSTCCLQLPAGAHLTSHLSCIYRLSAFLSLPPSPPPSPLSLPPSKGIFIAREGDPNPGVDAGPTPLA